MLKRYYCLKMSKHPTFQELRERHSQSQNPDAQQPLMKRLQRQAEFFLSKIEAESQKEQEEADNPRLEHIRFLLTGRESLLSAFIKLAQWLEQREKKIALKKPEAETGDYDLSESAMPLSPEDRALLKRYLERDSAGH